MRIEKLTIRNFRGIREGDIDGLADVNVLVGRNNCGKTTIAEALCRAAARAGGLDVFGQSKSQLWTSARAEQSEWPEEAWFRRDTRGTIVVGCDIDGHSFEYRHSLSDDTLVPARTDHPAGTEFLKGVTVFRPEWGFRTELESRLWERLLKDRSDKKVAAAVNEIFGLRVEALQILPATGKLMLLFAEHGLPLDVQGDGTRAALRRLLVLSTLRETLLILEEPETHQHPAALSRFASALCRQARAQDVQLLVTTQSHECLDAFGKAAAEVRAEAAVFHLGLGDGKLDVRRIAFADEQMLDEQGTDVRQLDLYV